MVLIQFSKKNVIIKCVQKQLRKTTIWLGKILYNITILHHRCFNTYLSCAHTNKVIIAKKKKKTDKTHKKQQKKQQGKIMCKRVFIKQK